jgi:formate-dependent nitrite reductase membrane component NrfD
VDEFVVAYRPQRVWNARVAWDLFLSGTGAGLLVLAVSLRSLGALSLEAATLSQWLALALVAAAGAVLLADLGVPARALRVLRRPRASWVSRGAWGMLLFSGVTAVALLPTLPSLGALPWRAGTPTGLALEGAATLLAVALMGYGGMLLCSWNAIPAWNTALLPVLFVTSSFLGGTGALMLVTASTGQDSAPLAWLGLALVAGVVLQLLAYVLVLHAGPGAARASGELLRSGPEARSFALGVILVGLALPTALLLAGMALPSESSLGLFVLAGVALLVGTFVLRQVVLRTGVYHPG